jgi:hypothetical protein
MEGVDAPQLLRLDPEIRNWVMLPIIALSLLLGLVRHYLNLTMSPSANAAVDVTRAKSQHVRFVRSDSVATRLVSRRALSPARARSLVVFATLCAQIVGRVRRTCQNGAYIPPTAFGMRKHFFTNKGGVPVSGSDASGSGVSSKVAEKVGDEAAASGDTFLLTLKPRTKDSLGLLRDTENVAGAPANPMMANPDGMMGPMKKQMAMQMPYMIMMSFVSYLFSGFVIAKIPFYLPTSFRLMVQRGVNIGALDVTYVSSLSWYFLAMFGLQGVYYLLLGANSGCVAVARVASGAACRRPRTPRAFLTLFSLSLRSHAPFLLFTVIFYVNLAHNLTRSPSHL